MADTLKKDYFEDPKFKERVTLIEQDLLEEILRDVIYRWDYIRPYLKNAGDKKSLEGEDRKDLQDFQKVVKKIAPEKDSSFKERLSWQLFYAMVRKDIGQYSAGEIRAFLRAIEIMGRTQSQEDNVNE